jgi:hypothetical protein
MGYNEETAQKIAYQINSGYWKVFNRCFFDKAECLRFASRIRNYNVTYHFYDEVYNTIDWTKSPEQSLDSMYVDRARKIRDKYKYIALLFSGGCDSTNMLKTFLKNGIKIDEVISFSPIEASDKLLHTFNRNDTSCQNLIFEYYEAIVPTLDYLKIHHPEIKITVIDYTRPALSFIESGLLEKVYLSGVTGTAHATGFYLSYKHVSKHDNSALIIAIDKPRIMYDKATKKFKSYFLDFNTILGHFPKETFNGDQPATEYFYFDPEMPYIPVKQCKQLLPDLINLLDTNHPYHSQVFIDKGPIYIVDMHHSYIKQLLYPGWNTAIFQTDKPNSHFFFEVNNWMLKTGLTDKKIKDFAVGQGKELSHGIDSKFVTYDDNGVPHKLLDMFTKSNPIH